MTRIFLLILIVCCPVMGQDADSHWPTAAKNGFGTSTSLNSKVWFTLANGVMTEVFYPTLDVPNVQKLEFFIINDGKIVDEQINLVRSLEIPNSNSLTFKQVNRAKGGEYTISKTYITDPRENTVLIDVDVDGPSDLPLYVYYDPSLNNSGLHDTAWNEGDVMLAFDGDKASALLSSCGFKEVRTERIHKPASVRPTGNVIQVVRLPRNRCTLALAFGKTVTEALSAGRSSLARGFEAVRREYESGWESYVATLPRIANHIRSEITATVVHRREGYHPLAATSAPTSRVEAGRFEITEPFTLGGQPRVGRTLTVTPGTYDPADADVTYTWLRGDRVVEGVTGRSYDVAAADLGKQLSVRVELRRAGYRDATRTLSAERTVTTVPTLAVDPTGLKRKAEVRLRLTAKGVESVGGRATVRIDGREVGGRVEDGRLRVVVRDLDPGRHTVRVSYDGTALVEAVRARDRVRVRR